MEIRLRHLLAFFLAVATTIGLWHLAQLAFGTSFENSNAPEWTAFASYFRLGAFLVPPVIVGFVFSRRPGVAGALLGLTVFSIAILLALDELFSGGRNVSREFLLEFFCAGLIYILFTALMSALVGWLRFKWFPRSPFGAVKLRLVLMFFAFVALGGCVFIKGLCGVYDEYRMSSTGITVKVTRMMHLEGDIYAVDFGSEGKLELGFELATPPGIRERFDRGGEVSIRYLPDAPWEHRWVEEDNSERMLGPLGLVCTGLGSIGMGILFWRRVRR